MVSFPNHVGHPGQANQNGSFISTTLSQQDASHEPSDERRAPCRCVKASENGQLQNLNPELSFGSSIDIRHDKAARTVKRMCRSLSLNDFATLLDILNRFLERYEILSAAFYSVLSLGSIRLTYSQVRRRGHHAAMPKYKHKHKHRVISNCSSWHPYSPQWYGESAFSCKTHT